MAGPGFEIKPSLLADFNTGIYETSIYGNIDSKIYPTLDSSNDTFNRQAGILQKYSPLPDLLFTAQGNYAHSTNATVLLNSTTPAATSIPSPIVSPANPALPGAAGVVANAQTVVDPNDTYTATASVYKEFNRAYAVFGGSISDATFETTPSSNYNLAAYYGAGGIWFSPLFYAFANGAQSFYDPAVGLSSASYFVKERHRFGSDRFFPGFYICRRAGDRSRRQRGPSRRRHLRRRYLLFSYPALEHDLFGRQTQERCQHHGGYVAGA